MDRKNLPEEHKKDSNSPENSFSRRNFLKYGLIAGASAVFLPKFLLAQDGCDLTTSDIEGPFYQPNVPFRTVLAAQSEPGTRLFIDGTVYADDCTTPIEGAIVDIWTANDAGCYSINESCTPPAPIEFNLRGQMLTNAQGKYAYETIQPGYYLNGSQFRPRHVHYKVIAPDNQTVLTTQLYFEGDPQIPGDPWASDPSAINRIIPLTTMPDGLHGTLDINLNASAVTGINSNEHLPDEFFMHQNYPNPFNNTTIIRYSLPAAANVKLSIYDSSGKEIERMQENYKTPGYHQFAWNGRAGNGGELSSGIYYYRLTAANKDGAFSQVKKLVLIK